MKKTFRIKGTSTGKKWTWSLSGIGLPFSQATAEAVPRGGSAADLARRWVESINLSQGRPPAYVAKFLRENPDGSAAFTISASRSFAFKVGDCEITGNREGCSFNPTVEEVIPVPDP